MVSNYGFPGDHLWTTRGLFRDYLGNTQLPLWTVTLIVFVKIIGFSVAFGKLGNTFEPLGEIKYSDYSRGAYPGPVGIIWPLLLKV